MTGHLEGRRAIVTGAGSGIGRAVADRLLRDGAQVLTADIQGKVDVLCDLTDAKANAALVAESVSRFDGLDIIVPCAGVSAFHALENHDDAYFDQVLDINLKAVFRLIRDAIPELKKSKAGRIVTIGSTTAHFGGAGLVAYCASKHAVLGMTKAVACELGPDNITVNCLCPGAIETPMTAPAFTEMPEFKTYWENKAALGRLGQPEDIANVIAFLVSDDAAFVSGQGFFADGGAMQAQ